MLILKTSALFLAALWVAEASPATDYARKQAAGGESAEAGDTGPISFSHFSLEHQPQQPAILARNHQPVLRVPVAVQPHPRSLPVALVSPVSYYSQPVPVREVPLLAPRAQYYAPPLPPAEYHPYHAAVSPLQPYYKQYHTLR